MVATLENIATERRRNRTTFVDKSALEPGVLDSVGLATSRPAPLPAQTIIAQEDLRILDRRTFKRADNNLGIPVDLLPIALPHSRQKRLINPISFHSQLGFKVVLTVEGQKFGHFPDAKPQQQKTILHHVLDGWYPNHGFFVPAVFVGHKRGKHPGRTGILIKCEGMAGVNTSMKKVLRASNNVCGHCAHKVGWRDYRFSIDEKPRYNDRHQESSSEPGCQRGALIDQVPRCVPVP